MDLSPTGDGAFTVGGVECRYMPPQALLLKNQLRYIDVLGLIPLLNRLVFDQKRVWDPPNLLLNGPTGTGKSLLAAFVAQSSQIPYLSIDCTEETRERQFKGGFVVKEGDTPFVLGAAANAIYVANLCGVAILVLEEMNALSSQQQKIVNALTDFRKKVEIPELSLRLDLLEGKKLWVIGTANPSTYGGVFDLNPDLKSRFLEIDIPYPTPSAEKLLLREMAPEGFEFEDLALDQLVNLARETRQGTTAYALSPRDLVETIRIVPRVGWEDAYFLLSQKFNGTERRLVRDRIQAITRLQLADNLGERRTT